MTNERLSDTILYSLNRLNSAKQSGALGKTELSKLIILEGSLFANQVNRGEKTEEDVEDFEKEWDEWCRLVRELSIPPEPDVPGKGTVIGELHCVDGVRGISTGDGGFVYLDGTVSQRFKRFEDLSIQEKEDLINAFEERNSRPGLGRLIIADALLEKMRSLAGGSAV